MLIKPQLGYGIKGNEELGEDALWPRHYSLSLWRLEPSVTSLLPSHSLA